MLCQGELYESTEAGALYGVEHDTQRCLLREREPLGEPGWKATKVELIINLKTTKALGLEVPGNCARRALER
jgi:hypothetical protein